MNLPQNLFVILLCLHLSCFTFGQNAPDTKEKTFYRNHQGSLLRADEVDSVMKKTNLQFASKKLVAIKELRNKKPKGDSMIYDFSIRLIAESELQTYKSRQVFVGKPLPSFSLKDLQGNRVGLEDFKGKPMVINMWFTTCPPCIGEMPELNKIKASGDYDHVAFLAITFESKSKVNSFLKKNTFNFQHLIDARKYCEQFTNSYPINIFVDKNGMVTEVMDGMPMLKMPGEKDWKVIPTSFLKALNDIK